MKKCQEAQRIFKRIGITFSFMKKPEEEGFLLIWFQNIYSKRMGTDRVRDKQRTKMNCF